MLNRPALIRGNGDVNSGAHAGFAGDGKGAPQEPEAAFYQRQSHPAGGIHPQDLGHHLELLAVLRHQERHAAHQPGLFRRRFDLLAHPHPDALAHLEPDAVINHLKPDFPIQFFDVEFDPGGLGVLDHVNQGLLQDPVDHHLGLRREQLVELRNPEIRINLEILREVGHQVSNRRGQAQVQDPGTQALRKLPGPLHQGVNAVYGLIQGAFGPWLVRGEVLFNLPQLEFQGHQVLGQFLVQGQGHGLLGCLGGHQFGVEVLKPLSRLL